MVEVSPQYSPVDTVDDDDEKLVGHAEMAGAEPRPKAHILGLWPWLSHAVLICTSVLSFTLWMGTPSPHLTEEISIYSPAIGAVEPIIVRYNGTLDFPSVYRGPPSPEIDAAWARVSHNVPPTRMTLEEMRKAGEADLPSKVKYPDTVGGGFMVSLDVTHQLHCLNLLRQASWIDYYRPIQPSFQEPPEVVRMHVDHCADMIKDIVICNADVTMITWDWVEGHEVPYPNLNTRHQCRNFERILDWAIEHAVHITSSEVTRFEDTVDLPPLPFHHGMMHHGA